MELILNKEPVYLSEVVFDGQAEQGVEFDYVLPDYYPDIFKILKCTLTPCIVSYAVSGTALTCDGVVYIKVLYLCDENKVHCIEQRYTYSKTLELVKPADGASVTIRPKTDYCNCRAVSGRRLDVRGAVSCCIKVTAARSEDVVTSVGGMGVESRGKPVCYCGEKLYASRQFIAREDIEAGGGKGSITGIISCDASASVTDCKVISDKAVIKGEAQIKALYLIKNGDTEEIESMEAAVPLSQIIDIPGITESHFCFANFCIMDCDLEIKTSEAGENRIFSCDLTVQGTVTACPEATVVPVSDMYSTDYESGYMPAALKAEAMPTVINETLILKTGLESKDGTIATVYGARCDIKSVICRADENGILSVSGQATTQVFGKLSDETPVFLEKTEAFELPVESVKLPAEYTIEPYLQTISTGYSISGDSTADLRIQLQLRGCLYELLPVEIVRDIEVLEDKPKEKNSDYALKLYYADENEDVWSIAKRYNTSSAAIIAENDLDGEKTTGAAMLLIPII